MAEQVELWSIWLQRLCLFHGTSSLPGRWCILAGGETQEAAGATWDRGTVTFCRSAEWVGDHRGQQLLSIAQPTNRLVLTCVAPIFIAHHWKQSQNPDTYYFVWDGQRRWNVSKKFFAIWANHWKQIVCSLKVTNLFLFLNLKTHTNKQYTIIISLLLNRFNASFYFFGFCLLIMVYFVKLQQSKVK